MNRKPSRSPYLAKIILSGMRRFSEEYSSIGDLNEEFQEISGTRGKSIARLWYWSQTFFAVLICFQLCAACGGAMFKNFLKITIRNMKKQKGHSLINISGLAMGMACFIMIALYIQKELSYDDFHEKGDRIYRVIEKRPGFSRYGSDIFCTTVAPLAPTLVNEFPDVIQATRIHTFYEDVMFHFENKTFYEEGLLADNHFFEIFSFPLLLGDTESALQAPLSLIISEELAKKYFNDEEPLGKIMTLNGKYDATITGIMKEIPDNSHLRFDFLLSLESINTFREDRNFLNLWNRAREYHTYIELDQNAGSFEVEEKFPAFIKKYMGGDDALKNLTLSLQSLKSIHLNSHANSELSDNSTMTNVYAFSLIAFVILIIACINYMNLSLARSFKRSKEVGVKNVLGASKSQLLKQFVGESFVHAILAFLSAVILVIFLLPSFNSLIDREIKFSLFENSGILLLLILMVVLTGLLSGVYPAVRMSSFAPLKMLRGFQSLCLKKAGFRNALMIIQFSVSILLINCTLLVFKQLNYIRDSNLGYNRDHIVVMQMRDANIRSKYESIKNTLLQNPDITRVTRSDNLPLDITSIVGVEVDKSEGPIQDQHFSQYTARVDDEFLIVFEMELIAGRNFSRRFANETQESVIINETAAKQLGWENPIGKKYILWPATSGKIIGMVRDFHFHSLHQKIKPLALTYYPGMGTYLTVRIRPGSIRQTIQFLKKTFESYEPVHPFQYYFLEDSFNSMYQREQKTGSIFGLFSVIAIFIAFLGLFGLAAFKAEARTKDIVIRKVLGASIFEIAKYLSKEFFLLIGAAFMMAVPVAFFIMKKWLMNFAYRAPIGGSVFFLSGILVMTMAVLTISHHTLKAATANPVDSLRFE